MFPDRWDCERQSANGNVITFTMLMNGTTNQRRCIEVTPHEQIITTTNPHTTGDAYYLFRVKPAESKCSLL